MKRVFVSFPITDLQKVKSQLLNWGNGFDTCCFLDNHEYNLPHHFLECILGAGCLAYVRASAGNAFDRLLEFSDQQPDWLFGHLGYDLKNETEGLTSAHPDGIGFPDLFFFVPQVVVELEKEMIRIGSFGDDHWQIFEDIQSAAPADDLRNQRVDTLQPSFSRSEYISTVELLRKHILRGDCYEINFCQAFSAEGVVADSLPWYQALSKHSPMPFGGYYKLGDVQLLCASPERYLSRRGRRLLSQPIKGTWARDLQNSRQDELYKSTLFNNAKERAENVMIVDLVRNDLSRVCVAGSVKVEELFGIYTFPQVHQMISAVVGEPETGRTWVDMVRSGFPMGSMTGAPKRRVLQLIETYERNRRGLFSGAIGYVTPERDFDFNVVIRSILYNANLHQLSFSVGSGITFYSQAGQEYEECMLKAAAIKKVLTG